jgi:hypothetical protein
MAVHNFALVTAFAKSEAAGYSAEPQKSQNWSTGIAGKGELIGSNLGCSAAVSGTRVRSTRHSRERFYLNGTATASRDRCRHCAAEAKRSDAHTAHGSIADRAA